MPAERDPLDELTTGFSYVVVGLLATALVLLGALVYALVR